MTRLQWSTSFAYLVLLSAACATVPELGTPAEPGEPAGDFLIGARS